MKYGRKTPLTVTVEDGVISGGFGETLSSILSSEDCRVVNLGWPDRFIEHGTQKELYERYNLHGAGIAERILIEKEN